ncbi:hypothetical protein [Polymorphospora rubra]|uniref:Uncharacterized protein n=1 Tax=Polymorphospora rubra TaxID=338584 RepID=A0A810MV95_9ACTN|nr:hypothetical protein [Polymorphospora rubra]BCJ65097.1 hypothetical protein Prubr_21180 [Polymorphospora rubra]
MDKDEALTRLADLVKQRAELDKALVAAVAEAKTAGANWTEIGSRLGQHRANAQKKYGPLLRETLVVEVRDTD